MCALPKARTALKHPTQYCRMESMDFRSQAFSDAALLLVQTTGCSLMVCRQELFIAETDMEQAYEVLVARRAAEAAEAAENTSH